VLLSQQVPLLQELPLRELVQQEPLLRGLPQQELLLQEQELVRVLLLSELVPLEQAQVQVQELLQEQEPVQEPVQGLFLPGLALPEREQVQEQELLQEPVLEHGQVETEFEEPLPEPVFFVRQPLAAHAE
jgi:hypothetical protein